MPSTEVVVRMRETTTTARVALVTRKITMAVNM